MFYQFLVASAFVFAAFCWDSSIRNGDTKKLNKLIRKASSVLGTALEPLELVVKKKMLQKLLTISDNTAHPLHSLLRKTVEVFNWRLNQLHCNKDCYKKYFLPSAISNISVQGFHPW